MDWKSEWKKLAVIVGVFALCFWLPVGTVRFNHAVLESFHLVKWYAREHVLLCLVPAFFIAGAIGVFVSQASVMKYLGAKANKVLAYGVASVSGTILAVCSCTVLPLFAGIYRMGAGLGPACAFLYSGPAINVLAIVLTARILGLEMGIARAVGAIVFSVVIGLLMQFFFRKEETEKAKSQMGIPEPEISRPLWKNALYFAAMVGILVFSNWGAPNDFRFELKDGTTFRGAITMAPEDATAKNAVYRVKMLTGVNQGSEVDIPVAMVAARTPLPGVWTSIWRSKWYITSVLAVLFGVILVLWFSVPWWKVAAAGVAPVILALTLPTHGLWVLLPFGTGIIGLSVVLYNTEGEMQEWFGTSWTFAKQILPLLLGGVVVSGLLLGRVGNEGLIPSEWVSGLVGGNSIWANFFASFVGALMYFATLTEVPILQGLIGAGMGKGPALALLLAGPALSLPNMLVIRSIMGTKKTIVFVSLVILMATITGMAFGAFFK
ncbi:MAG: permease [Lentisphaeria bacterium]|nr:permease [Lentisphaeria bacterium]